MHRVSRVILKHKSRIREQEEESRGTRAVCYLGYPGLSKGNFMGREGLAAYLFV